MAIKINTSKVDSAASNISRINSNIRNDFSAVTSAINVLNRNWDGSASDNAIRAFNSIKESYCDYRYSVINDLVLFLKNQVKANYENTEQKIQTVADNFKTTENQFKVGRAQNYFK